MRKWQFWSFTPILRSHPISKLLLAAQNSITITCCIATLSFILTACSSNPNRTEGAEGITWLSYQDPDANAYGQQCRLDYSQANRIYQRLEFRNSLNSTKLLNELNNLHIALDKALSRASLFRNVHPNKELRSAANECFRNFYSLNNDIGLSRPIYQHLKQVKTENLAPIDQKYVSDLLLDFQRAGVALSKDKRTKLKALNREITILGQDFTQNIREDERKIRLDSPLLLEGLPQDFIDNHPPNDAGFITVSTDYPDYHPIIQYAKHDKVRLELYKMFRKRGYPVNAELLEKLLQKRYEYAQLLGYDNFADYITEDQMIGSPANAKAFIDKINDIASPKAEQEYSELLAYLQREDPQATQVGDWQKSYLQDQVRNEKYHIDSQEVRQYFHYDKVKQGIFDLTESLFKVTIKPWETDTWHASVEAYEMWEGEKLIGQFYLDMHPREGKYKHAAAFGIQDGVAGVQAPITALVCNFPGGENNSGFMEHGQVETFLHEFGHLLHSMFGGHQKWLAHSGIKTERDFVEAPSQMLEEWILDYYTLKTFATNDNGQVIPKPLVDKMVAARRYGQGLYARHQIFYAATSLSFYNSKPSDFELLAQLKKLQAKYSPFDYVEDTYFYTSFGHLYGYSALYYTYMWSQVIAKDMFSEFERLGIHNPTIALRYRESVLEPGGSQKAETLIKNFLGRPYNFDAFAKALSANAETN